MSANILLDQMMTSQRSSADGGVFIEDVFSSWIYEGNSSTQNIISGMDFSGKGGLCWIKNRDATDSHILTDTERGAGEILSSDTTTAETTDTDTVTAFNSDGFSLGADVKVNTNGESYIAWQFLEQPRFFDVVKYTGNGVAGREIAHDLGCEVGMMIVKKTSSSSNANWIVYHRGNTANPETDYLVLNETYVTADNDTIWNDTAPTDSVFTLGSNTHVNLDTEEFIAYLFAEDKLGPTGDGSDGLICCNSFTTDGSGDTTVTMPQWEPQLVMAKPSSATGNWDTYDMMRGTVTGGNDSVLSPNLSDAEVATSDHIAFTALGFEVTGYQASTTYIYMAIRRPMKTPQSSSECFAIDESNNSDIPAFYSGFPVDMAFFKNRAGASGYTSTSLDTTAAESSPSTSMYFDFMDGWRNMVIAANYPSYMFKRASGFFDVVTYTGDGVAGREVEHNLGVEPEMMWIKRRNSSGNWHVYTDFTGVDEWLYVNTNAASAYFAGGFWDGTAPALDVFTLGSSNGVNANGDDHIAYLFATLPGISKVDSYTGDGTTNSSKVIDCGFTIGAKFIIIKATSTTGDWSMIDSTRGLTKWLELNTTNAEATGSGVVVDSSGFIINEDTAALNTNGVDYIFYAISN